MRAVAPLPLAGTWRPELALSVAAWLVFLGFAYGPAIGISGEAIGYLLSGDEAAWALVLPSARRAVLLAKSLGSAAATAALSGLAGTLAALGFPRLAAGRTLPRFATTGMVAALVVWAVAPPYLHALGAMEAGYWLGATLRGLGLAVSLPELPGWAAVIMIQSFALLPFAAGAAFAGFIGIERDLVEAGAVFKNDRKVFVRIVFPLALPALSAGIGAVFVFALLDSSTPSLFGVSSYAMEIRAEYGASHSAWRAALLALPLILAAGIVIALVLAGLRHTRSSHGRSWRRALASCRPADPLPILSWLGLVTSAGYAALALLLLGGGLTLWDHLPELVFTARQDLLLTVANGLAAAALALVPAAIIAWSLVSRARSPVPRWVLWALALMPLALPPSLTGIGIAALFTGAPDGLRTFVLVPALTHVARFLPLAVLVISAQIRRLDPLLVDAARLQRPSGPARWGAIEIPLMAPGLVAAFGLTFCGSIGELEATLLSAPPGAALLSMRVFNYLHYGVSETVAALGLVMVALVWLGVVAGLWLMRNGRELR